MKEAPHPYRVQKRPDPRAGNPGPGWLFVVQRLAPVSGCRHDWIDVAEAEFFTATQAWTFVDMLIEGEQTVTRP